MRVRFPCATRRIICCEKETDAKRVREALSKRLAKYKLTLNEEKTKKVAFSKKKVQEGIPQGTFDFLGFTFYWGKSRTGIIIPKLKTSGKTMRKKLVKVGEWAKQIRNRTKWKDIWKTFCAKLRGHIQYYGVSFNSGQIQKFSYEAKKIIFKWANRRSQKKSFTWEKFLKFEERYPLPRAVIYHRLY